MYKPGHKLLVVPNLSNLTNVNHNLLNVNISLATPTPHPPPAASRRVTLLVI
ncbi:hypothetical protein HanPI659440_Chr04g0171721 [Helianthus annuus]|nr:hypothetical protein HanPI659440_Chr04g0171721 [Helianthus annuus]